MSNEYELNTAIIKASVFRINESIKRIEKCLNMLGGELVWHAPNENSNSMGNLVLHLCGNITQYIISALGKNEDNRDRDAEFANKEKLSITDLIRKIREVEKKSVELIESLNSDSLLARYKVQGFDFNGVDILIHVVEHLSYHTGQITYFTKEKLNTSTAYYDNVDLNTKNEI